MSEKSYDVNSGDKAYKVTFTFDAKSLGIKVQNKNNEKEVYETQKLSLQDIQNTNKVYKQFDDAAKIANVVGTKLEKNNYLLETGGCVLKIKFTNEVDEIEYVPFVIPLTGSLGGEAASNGGSDEINKLKEENDKLKKENQELKNQIEKLKSGSSSKPPSNKPSTSHSPAASLPPSDYKPVEGTFFQRMDTCVNRKKNIKPTLDSMFARLTDLKKVLDNTVGKLFAGDPSVEERLKVLGIATEVLKIYREFKDIQEYHLIFPKEIEEKKIKLSADEKKKFDEAMEIFYKRFPFDLAPYYQKIENTFKDVIKNFFIEKNLRFYKPEETKEALKLKNSFNIA